MSRGHVELVRCTFDAIFSRDFQRAAAGLDDHVVWHNTRAFPGPSICVGPQAIAEFWEALMDTFDGENRIEQIVDGEQGVALGVRGVGRAAQSGIPLDVKWGAAARIAAGKIARVDVYGDLANAVKAVGPAE